MLSHAWLYLVPTGGWGGLAPSPPSHGRCAEAPAVTPLSAVFIMNEPAVTGPHARLRFGHPILRAKGRPRRRGFSRQLGSGSREPQPEQNIGHPHCHAAPTHGCPGAARHGPDTLSQSRGG